MHVVAHKAVLLAARMLDSLQKYDVSHGTPVGSLCLFVELLQRLVFVGDRCAERIAARKCVL